jgi:hypothetical protein
MLKVLPIQTKEEQALATAKCNVVFKPDALAYAATVDEVFVGVGQFKLTPNGGEVYDIALIDGKDDFEAMFVMGRGTLNFIDLCEVHYAKFVGEVKDESLLRAVGFKKNEDGIFDIDLEGFFTDHCHNHKENNQ